MTASFYLALVNDMNDMFEEPEKEPARIATYEIAYPYCKAWLTALRGGDTANLPRRNARAEHCLQQMLECDKAMKKFPGLTTHYETLRSYYEDEYRAAIAARASSETAEAA